MDCIFCKIANKEIPSEIVYEDDRSIVFKDLNPEAPVHLLVIPKEHIESAFHIGPEHKELMGHLIYVASKVAEEFNLSKGYRIVNNCGLEGGQTVGHLHYHLLGGRELQWPPG